MFDLPSIMNTLLQKTYDMVKTKELEDDQKEEWMKYELDHFVQRLYKLVKQQGLLGTIEIVILKNQNIDDIWPLMKEAYETIKREG